MKQMCTRNVPVLSVLLIGLFTLGLSACGGSRKAPIAEAAAIDVASDYDISGLFIQDEALYEELLSGKPIAVGEANENAQTVGLKIRDMY